MHADPAMPPGYGECGGTQTYMRELLDEFGRLNISCILVTRKSMNYLPNEEQYNSNCRIIRLINGNDEPMSKLLLYRYHEENLEKISHIIESQEELPFIIHSVYWNSGRLAMELSKKYGIAFVHSVISNARGRINRGAHEPMKQRAQFEQEIYNNAAKILCVSDDEKHDLIELYHISSDKLIACGQYVDNSFMNPSHDANGYPHINSRITSELQERIALKYNDAIDYNSKSIFWQYKAFTYFGRLDLNKGILQIIEAWYNCYKIYGEYCPPLWIVGGSITDIDSIRKKISIRITELKKLEQNYKLVWWGYLNTQGLSTVLLKTQAVLMHSLYEPGGRVVVEAMSEGIPVIGTFNGFAKDFISDWKNGFLVNYNDITSLSERIEHFIRQPFLSEVLGKQARIDSKNIIKCWRFIENHLQAYGIPYSLPQKTADAGAVKNESPNVVCIFPYAERELADEYISSLFATFSSQKILSIQSTKKFPNHRLLQTAQEYYYIKQLKSQLMYEPLYNPFAKELFVTDTQKEYFVEATIQSRLQSAVFIGGDPLHRLLFYRKTDETNANKLDYPEKCLDAIFGFPDVSSAEERIAFTKLINQTNFSCENDVEHIFKQLDAQFPQFLFPHSGIFSLKLAWAISLQILKYNKHILSPKIYKHLYSACQTFNFRDYPIEAERIRTVLLEFTANTFKLFRNEFILTGLHKTCLGTIETEVGIFLFNYCKQKKISFLSFIRNNKIFNKLIKANIKMEELMSTIAYCIFQDIIVKAVIYHESCENLLTNLKSIIKQG